ncbi:MAG TPA: 30S ribosomal protein S21 [Spirochaetia bacterium]|nr:30S ribosomal protein S21 [Spirochaetia bacterium]
MATVNIKENDNIEIAIKKFRKEVEKEGILKVLKDKQFYKKPSLEKKIAKEKSEKRLKRKMRKEKRLGIKT